MEDPADPFGLLDGLVAAEIGQFLAESCVNKLQSTKLKTVDRHNYYATDLITTLWYAQQIFSRVKSLTGCDLFLAQNAIIATSVDTLERDIESTLRICQKLTAQYRNIIDWLDEMVSLVRHIATYPTLVPYLNMIGSVSIGMQHPCEATALFSIRSNAHIVTTRLNALHETLSKIENEKGDGNTLKPTLQDVEQCVGSLLTCFMHKQPRRI